MTAGPPRPVGNVIVGGVNVAVNLTWCLPGLVGGSEQYLARQLLGLAEASDEFAATLYAARGYAAAHPDVAARWPVAEAPVPLERRALRVVVENTWLARRTRGAALVHHGGGTLPTIGNRRTVLTVHDLQYLEYPQYFSRHKLAYLRQRMPRSLRRATVVTVPSTFVAGTITEAYGVDPQRIVVVPHGLESTIGQRATPEAELRARYGLGQGRILVLPAATFPHKGHRFLLDLVERSWTDPDVKILFVGGAGLAEEEIQAEIARRRLGGRVIRAGRVGPEDRDGLVMLAEALVFPSEYEGFGAPLIEAMALGTPVIASDRAAIPEVLGGAGLSLPLDPDAWAGALDVVATRREELVAAGRERVAAFSTAASGSALAAAYRRALR